jgi:aryl-alcohol dehydrogenase-like predicted oxidoreductase
MDYRHLGQSGLKISEIAYGNWITHGSQVEEEAAAACVYAALDEGITTFDTADGYASGRAEEVLGRALHVVPRGSVEIFTKVYWPTADGPTLQNPNVSAAIVGATRPEQVRENVKAAGVRLDAGLMRRIDEALGDVVERDPARTASPPVRP